jgi:hypothetical protein
MGKADVSTGPKLHMGKLPNCLFGVHINEPTGNIMALHDAFRGKEFQPNDAGLEGYPYRAEIAYNPSVGGSEGYQFLVKTYYAEDAEHGGDAQNVNGTEVLDGEPTPIPKIYLNKLCRWDFGDVRFQLKGVTGTTAYTYKLIEKVDGVSALFLFKMNENPDTARTVCCYWGKQTATDESSDEAAEAIVPNVVGAWPLDEAAATDPAVDYSGNGNHGTATGTTIIDSPYTNKKARHFNGYGDNLSLPLPNGVYNTDFTIIQAIKLYKPNAQAVWSKTSMIGSQSLRSYMCIIPNSNVKDYTGTSLISYYYRDGVQGQQNVSNNATILQGAYLNNWIILEWRYIAATRTMSQWANGVKLGTDIVLATNSVVDVDPATHESFRLFALGAKNSSGAEPWKVDYACFHVIYSALSDAQMSLFTGFNIYPDPRLIEGSIVVRKWASTTLPTVASVSSMQTRKSYGKQELYPALDNLNFTLDQANKKASVEFYLENTQLRSPNTLILSEDDGASYWTIINEGTGTFGVELSNDTTDTPNGSTSSLKITAITGTCDHCYLKKNFASPRNWTTYDFIGYYVKGRNSGRTRGFQIWTGDTLGTNRLMFSVVDNFIGWKLCVFPLRSPTVSIGTPNLADVRAVMLWDMWPADFTESENWVKYDSFALDAGVWAYVEVGVPDKLIAASDLALYSWNPSTSAFLTPPFMFASCESDGVLTNNGNARAYMLNGTTLVMMYPTTSSMAITLKGKRNETKSRNSAFPTPGIAITYSKAKTRYRVGFAIKMPPADLNASATSGGGQCRLKLEVYYQ